MSGAEVVHVQGIDATVHETEAVGRAYDRIGLDIED